MVSNLANQFAKEGDQVIVATEWIGQNEFVLDEPVRRVIVGPEGEEEQKGRIAKAILRITKLRKFVKTEKPDVLIAFDYKASYRALAACKGVKCPVIVSVRTDPVGHYDGAKDKVLIPLLYPRANGCVFQTVGQKEFFPEYLQRRSRVILNPLNRKYEGVRQVAEPEKTVVQHGRLVDFKNQAMLIRAFAKVHAQHPDYDLKIYGPDSFDGTKELLEKTIAELDAAPYVTLMGGSDSLDQQIPQCAVYAFSSDWEGLPNALIEAMCMGMPCVATDCPCGGPRTIMEHEVSGLMIGVGDEKALADGICRLIEDPELAKRLGENAAKLVERVKDTAITGQWRDYIKQVIGEYR